MTGKIIDINEQIVKDHLGELVRNGHVQLSV